MIPPRLQRGSDSMAGGEVDALHADVMRFLALLGFTLAALFALARSGEAPPEPVPPGPPVAESAPPIQAPPPATPLTTSPPPSPKGKARLPMPAPSPSVASKPVAPAPTEATGYGLRFASTTALKVLLRAGQVSLYLRKGRRWERMVAQDQGWALRPASAPGQMHEMLPTTVPEDFRVLAQGANGSWGVQLSQALEGQLARYLRPRGRVGTLAIYANGQVRLEADRP